MSDRLFSLLNRSLTDDNYAFEMKSRREMQLRAIDNILDLVGAEYIQLFLPMWETSGNTFKDLLKPDLTFALNGPSLNRAGPFGSCPLFDGINDYAIQDPVPDESTMVETSSQALAAPTAAAVQKMKPMAQSIGFVRLRLIKTGTPDGSVKVELRSTKSGAASATTELLSCSSIGTSVQTRGFYFVTPPNIAKAASYYLALVYDSNTNADGANNIAWRYDSAGGYGQGRNYYDGGTWVDTPTEDHAFDVYDSRLVLPDDWSFVWAANVTQTGITQDTHFAGSGMTDSVLKFYYGSTGYIELVTFDTSQKYASPRRWPINNNHIFAVTFSKALDTAKAKVYQDGIQIGTSNGTAATANVQLAQPLTIGCRNSNTGALTEYHKGYLGPFIMASKTLLAAEVAKVSHNLLVMRKLREAV